MSDQDNETKPLPSEVDDLSWGEKPKDHMGYASEAERMEKRGLEDWEMVEHMEDTRQSIPYWFIAVFFVLLLVAIGLTFPFWGNRPGFEREWFDWGIPGGALWVISMSALIYYLVDYRYIRRKKKEDAEKAKKEH